MLALSHALGIQWWSKYTVPLPYGTYDLWWKLHGVPDAGKVRAEGKRVSKMDDWMASLMCVNLGKHPEMVRRQGGLAYMRAAKSWMDTQLATEQQSTRIQFPKLGRRGWGCRELPGLTTARSCSPRSVGGSDMAWCLGMSQWLDLRCPWHATCTVTLKCHQKLWFEVEKWRAEWKNEIVEENRDEWREKENRSS